MGLLGTLRKIQDASLDAGWRIRRIPWQAPGRPEFVHGTPMTRLLAWSGLTLFVGTTVPVLFGWASPAILAATPIAFAALVVSRLLAVRDRTRGWVRVRARCVDREIRQVLRRRRRGRPRSVWCYRLLCEYTREGRTHSVTPETTHLADFDSETKLREYLAARIDDEGRCMLWVDPARPLRSCFPERPRI